MKNCEIIDIFNAPGQKTSKVEEAYVYICENFPVNENKKMLLRQKLRNLDFRYHQLWQQAKRIKARFECANEDFLNAPFGMEEFLEVEPTASTSSGRGRPSKPFDELSIRSKRRKIDNELIDPKEDTIEKVLLAARRTAYNRSKTSLVKVIGYILNNSDNAAKMFITLKDSRGMMSAEEAFEYFLDWDMTKYVYEQTHKKNPARFPTYKVIQTMKAICSPPVESIEESSTKIQVRMI